MIELALRYARIPGCVVLLMWSGHLTGKAQPQSDVPPRILIAPESYLSLIPRLSSQPSVLYRNLLYEGNNNVMRGSSTPHSERRSGLAVAERWRSIVVHTQGTFLLRDALFSQQDHAYHVSPFALMLPANWITAAASESGNIQPLVAPDVHNDSAWLAIATPEQMFGRFPPSDVLFKVATSATDSGLEYNARETIVILARYAQRLIDRRKSGIETMIQEGADIIAESDTLYFGSDVRRHHVIPIMVENPTLHESRKGRAS